MPFSKAHKTNFVNHFCQSKTLLRAEFFVFVFVPDYSRLFYSGIKSREKAGSPTFDFGLSAFLFSYSSPVIFYFIRFVSV